MIPTSEHIREAEELLPPKGCSCNENRLDRLGYHDEYCPAYYRPTITQALASRDAKHALDIAGRDAKFEAHTKAVSAFLNELLAVYDPCADTDAVIPVKDACAALLLHATTERQSAYDRDARIAALEGALRHCIRHVDEYANCADEIELGAYGACREVSDIARTALKQDTPAS